MSPKKKKKFVRLIKVGFWAFITAVIAYNTLLINVPSFSILDENSPKYSSYMKADEKLSKSHHKNGITFIPLSKISSHMIKAVLVSEDDLFFQHDGLNYKEIYRAILTNLKRGKLSRGASTITQQLSRNLYLSKNKSFIRKLREVLITFRLEQTLTKGRILEMYLNYAEFGPGIYGIKAASSYHFATTPRNLSSSQAALLAATLPNPKKYGRKPYSRTTHNRMKKIKRRMAYYDLEIPKALLAKNTVRKKTPKITLKIKENVKDDFSEFEDLNPDEVFVDE